MEGEQPVCRGGSPRDAKRRTSAERYELMQILEDIEDNALADKAEAEGGWTKLADLEKEPGRA